VTFSARSSLMRGRGPFSLIESHPAPTHLPFGYGFGVSPILPRERIPSANSDSATRRILPLHLTIGR